MTDKREACPCCLVGLTYAETKLFKQGDELDCNILFNICKTCMKTLKSR